MSLKPPLMELPIETAEKGFYSGFSMSVAVVSKIIIASLVIWAIVFPEQAGSVLNAINSFILANTAYWYIWIVALFFFTCAILAIIPATGKLKLGVEDDVPEFARFSWFAMMFGAAIGVGMLTWAVAEPVYHFQNNPDVIAGTATGSAQDNVINAYKWSNLHWGFGAWACYGLTGMAMAFFSYRRGLPLTVRSSLIPIFGKHLSGPLGNVIDIVAVVATILGVAQALGFGVEQFVSGMTRIGIGGLTDAETGTSNTLGILVSITIIMVASTASALSGVGKGIKILSNINMILSIFLLGFFLIFGSTFFGLNALVMGFIDYIVNLPTLLFQVFRSDGVEGSVATNQENWQGAWSVFYWAWWVAFAPFVGLFLARISKGRSIREFVLGAMVMPAIMCFIWFSFAGGTAIDLTLNGDAGDVIFSAPDGDKIFAMVIYMLGANLGWVMSVLIVVLLLTYLVTTADSAVLIVNTINAAGDEGPKARPHIYFWGVALGGVVAALLIAGGPGGGLKAIQTAMVIGAFPFSIVMVLQCVSLVKAVWNDTKRNNAGIQSTTDAVGITSPAE
ncbi:BCCT family transporter [Loktanella sp. D2R18]|uniref:BCCT family transporter n=1 Tax=Rhodobacterales TaxID=204455 RepID=UPI000DEBCEBD|nr:MULTISPECIES: BCCT family transporter [Rhodobacterales]MDO6588848.1 BCCT family transporter [Yoonia sp. 1_MG-2023]RBW41923.1 BCCT family transporter [Loktanella sp. D2R18]